jgi:hypothetical protein
MLVHRFQPSADGLETTSYQPSESSSAPRRPLPANETAKLARELKESCKIVPPHRRSAIALDEPQPREVRFVAGAQAAAFSGAGLLPSEAAAIPSFARQCLSCFALDCFYVMDMEIRSIGSEQIDKPKYGSLAHVRNLVLWSILAFDIALRMQAVDKVPLNLLALTIRREVISNPVLTERVQQLVMVANSHSNLAAFANVDKFARTIENGINAASRRYLARVGDGRPLLNGCVDHVASLRRSCAELRRRNLNLVAEKLLHRNTEIGGDLIAQLLVFPQVVDDRRDGVRVFAQVSRHVLDPDPALPE